MLAAHRRIRCSMCWCIGRETERVLQVQRLEMKAREAISKILRAAV